MTSMPTIDLPAIRVAHIADTHLGYRGLTKLDPETERNQRAVDVERAFERAIDAILAQKPDLVLHAGDVFHHTRPTWHAMRVFVRQMRRLEQADIPTVVIAGNHDTPRLRTSGTAFSVLELALPEIMFLTGYEEEERIFEKLGLVVFGVPHGAMSLTTYDPVAYVKPGLRNVLMTHGMIPGMDDVAQYEPGTEMVKETLLDTAFDYIALGHYHVWHRPRANAWYAGSTERFGWGDEDADPGFLMLTFAEGEKTPAIEHIPIETRPMRTLPAINGEGLPAREIANVALKRAEAVDTPSAMTRIELRQVARSTRREVDQLIRRELNSRVWSLDLYTRADLLANIGERTPLDSDQINVRTLFEEFVDERTKLGAYEPAFAESFRAKGLAAIGAAMERVNQELAEGER
jgi:DNA repair exonuclease SbcCD nuclease subunit